MSETVNIAHCAGIGTLASGQNARKDAGISTRSTGPVTELGNGQRWSNRASHSTTRTRKFGVGGQTTGMIHGQSNSELQP